METTSFVDVSWCHKIWNSRGSKKPKKEEKEDEEAWRTVEQRGLMFRKMTFSEFEVAATVLAFKKETKTSHEANDSRT